MRLPCSKSLEDIVFCHLVTARFTFFLTLYVSFCVQALSQKSDKTKTQ